MTNTKPTMLHSDRGSVFSVFSEEELKNMTNNSKRKVAICGRINNSGIVEVPEGATLAEIIELAGGILDKKDLCKVFAESDIFVMVSHSETFGLVYIEALSQGLPILYTRGQGIDGTLKEKIGEAADSYDENSIKKAICRLIDEYEQYEPIGKSLYRFSWDNIARDVIRLIH